MMTIQAVRLHQFGSVDNLTLESARAPPLETGQIRVEIRVAGLNPVDWQIVESEELSSAFGLSLPSGFGNDFAGVVVELGPGATRWAVGDRVYGGARGAAVATSVVLDEHHRRSHRLSGSRCLEHPAG